MTPTVDPCTLIRFRALAERPESRRWLEFEATAKAEQILVGLGNYNTYSARDIPGYPGFQGFALRLFDQETGSGGSGGPQRSGVASLTRQLLVASGTVRAATDTSANATNRAALVRPVLGHAQVVAKVNQSADGGPTDVDGRPLGNLGAWESTGIVDASAAFGPGAFLINIQAHALWVEQAPGDDNNGDGFPDFTYKREGGQLLLIHIP